MVLSHLCEGHYHYTPEPGEVVHQGRGKCQECSRAEVLLNRQSLTFQHEARKDQDLEASRYSFTVFYVSFTSFISLPNETNKRDKYLFKQ